jgi:hypothetical protein
MSTPQPWLSLLRAPRPSDHVIQLYTDDAFLNRAVGEFVSTGLLQRGAAVLVATPAHAEGILRTLGKRLDVATARRSGRLVVLDAQACLDRFMVDGHPDRAKFLDLVNGVLDSITKAGFLTTRLFGEMVDLLWNHDLPATVALEQLWNEVLASRRVSLLCAYGIDNFDRQAHRRVLHQLSRCHSHLVPVEDYERFEHAVDRAYHEVFGAGGDAGQLRELIGRSHAGTTVMPAAQAALVALRDVRRDLADDVLARARRHYFRA